MKMCIKCRERLDEKYFELRQDTNKLRNICRRCNKGYLTNLKDKQDKIQRLLVKGKKECSRCLSIKELEYFSKDKYTVTKHCSFCKECVRVLKNSEYSRNRRLIKNYNIDLEEYIRLYNLQEGRCTICDRYFEKLNIDHNYSTGNVRGLLCFHCNAGLGHYRDDPKLLLKSIEYLGNNFEINILK